MLAGIRKRLARKHFDIKECDDDDKDELHSAFVPPPNYIKISQGKIQLVHQSKSLESDVVNEMQQHQQQLKQQHQQQQLLLQQQQQQHNNKQSEEVLESRIVELEGALLRLQEKVNNSQCGSPTFEKELRDQLENMQRVIKSKDRKTMQACRDHKVLQTRFARQENLLQTMQLENKNLIMRIRQYEHCLDDVMRKVVDAIVAEDNLREEVAMLKSRVRDLEEQNAALSASPAKGRDEGYCTMSSGQPQPSNGHLEDLPEEPEQWLLPAEPCSTEMEDWSMSQEELAVITLDDEREHQLHQHQLQQQQQQLRQHGRTNGEHDWIWNSNDFLNSTIVETDSVSDGISQLLQQKIVYSEDEEVACTEFTNDFYKLVNIRGAGSTRSLYSYIEGETDDEDEDEDDDDEQDDSSLSESNVPIRSRSRQNGPKAVSPTPSEAGRAQVTSCSSSESDEISRCTTHQEMPEEEEEEEVCETLMAEQSDFEIECVQLDTERAGRGGGGKLNEKECIENIIKTELRRHPLVKSKSVLEEQEPSCILRNNQRREIESSVVRSGSVNGVIAVSDTSGMNGIKSQERLIAKPANSWRKSNGWKRVTSPVSSPTHIVSPKKETRSENPKPFHTPTKALPTRIPTSIPQPQLQHTQHVAVPQQQQQQQQPTRKSKIPPPVPVRRSYAS